MTPPASLESDFLYMLRNFAQTDGENCVQCCCSPSSTCRGDMCRDSSLYWTCVCVGVFFENSSAKLNIPQPGGHLTTCSSSIEHVTVLCGFTLTPSSGIRQDCLFEYAQFARPLGMEELRQGLITCIIQRPGSHWAHA